MVKFGNRKEENFVRFFFPFCYLKFDETEILFLFFYFVFMKSFYLFLKILIILCSCC